MNCHRARLLISPYLDHQLSGREKLALQDHLAVCASCDRERQSLRQIKLLLRGLAEPRPPRGFSPGDFSQRFSETIALRLEQTDSALPSWRVTHLAPMHLTPPRPQRGRRLATALALSCLTVVSFAPAVRAGSAACGAVGGVRRPGVPGAGVYRRPAVGPAAGAGAAGISQSQFFSAFCRIWNAARRDADAGGHDDLGFRLPCPGCLSRRQPVCRVPAPIIFAPL